MALKQIPISASEDFERRAEVFYRETGWLAPGKDLAAVWGEGPPYAETLAKFSEWSAQRARLTAPLVLHPYEEFSDYTTTELAQLSAIVTDAHDRRRKREES